MLYLTVALSIAGAPGAAKESAARALATDPLCWMSWEAVGVAQWFDGGLAGSLDSLRRAVELDPANFIAHWCLGYACASAGDFTAAAAEVGWLVAAGSKVPYTIQLQSLVLAQQGDRAQALALASPLDLSPFDNHITFHFSAVFAMCGETERALDVLASSVNKGFCPAPFIEVHGRFLEPLRSHARFGSIVATAKAMSSAIRRELAALSP
jgi:hypothetical protein